MVAKAENALVQVDEPSQDEIATTAQELSAQLVTSVRDAASLLLADVMDDNEAIANSQVGAHIQLTLIEIRLMQTLGFNLDGAIATAREAGATWDQIGQIFDLTRQGAYERWGKPARQLLDARQARADRAAEPINPLDQFDPTYPLDTAATNRRRRRGVSHRRG
ncbi:hypothetical protein AB0H71_23715 [Nocardia sp. NPDC050697]|uniref:hypothetical protein n=1 Tax=Nocardia sp. NPDC050697 TaxID=3155158 RepID=UPI00340334C2